MFDVLEFDAFGVLSLQLWFAKMSPKHASFIIAIGRMALTQAFYGELK
jgi:hypothetical protein